MSTTWRRRSASGAAGEGRERRVLGCARDEAATLTLRFTVRVPGELRSRDVAGAMVRAACQHVERACARSGLEWRVLSAFNEAFNNVVEHAYAERAGAVAVCFHADDDRVVLRMIDQGTGFDFTRSGATVAPAFETLSEGGMGMFIIRALMSEVSYVRRRGHNHLTMIKRLSECPGASEARGG